MSIFWSIVDQSNYELSGNLASIPLNFSSKSFMKILKNPVPRLIPHFTQVWEGTIDGHSLNMIFEPAVCNI